MIQYEIRAVLPSDEDDLLRVAGHLNTVNLPNDRERIRHIIEHSARSFSGEEKDVRKREYVFALLDRVAGRIAGTSMIIAQLGRRDAPYIFFDVINEEKYSQTLDTHFHHTLLRIGYSYNGPTEIGGLIVHPDYRRVPAKLGQLISHVRFLWIATHRHLFQDQILAELLPPLEADGTSHLWEALGRHFTGLSYADADILSKRNKEFIKSLFPDGFLYASLLPADAQGVIGKVGAQTRGVEKMLRRIGFRYARRIDPFDGGPHFIADTDAISLVPRARRTHFGGPRDVSNMGRVTCRGLLGIETVAPPHFLALTSRYELEGDGVIFAPRETADHLKLAEGDALLVLPLE